MSEVAAKQDAVQNLPAAIKSLITAHLSRADEDTCQSSATATAVLQGHAVCEQKNIEENVV